MPSSPLQPRQPLRRGHPQVEMPKAAWFILLSQMSYPPERIKGQMESEMQQRHGRARSTAVVPPIARTRFPASVSSILESIYSRQAAALRIRRFEIRE
jgi:hypothetical protein